MSERTPEEQLLWEIFGDPTAGDRRRRAMQTQAEARGHHTTRRRVAGHKKQAVCTCGWRSTIGTSAQMMADVWEHRRIVTSMGELTDPDTH